MQLLHGVVLSGAFMLGGAVVADTYYVPDDFTTIQAALDFVATEGDEIIVRRGTYQETIDFLGKAVWLHSEEGRDVTTIDAGMPDPPMSVVTARSGEGPETVLEGFTIRGGTGTWFEYEEADYLVGGGMFVLESSPTVKACTFEANEALNFGGGLFVWAGDTTAESTTFRQNNAQRGGGMSVGLGSATVVGSLFQQNDARGGGGLSVDDATVLVNACRFEQNTAVSGGGVSISLQSEATIISSTFVDNLATWQGGGVTNTFSHASLVNCVLGGNRAGWGGGVFNNHTAPMYLGNCTFMNNDAGSSGAVFNGATLDAVNSVFWNNGDNEIWTGSEATTQVSYSDIRGGYEGVGNIAVDPLCADPDNGDFRLLPGSLCIDAGANNAVPVDDFDLDDDMDTSERLPLDLDGNPRFADLDSKEDTGCGLPVVVDMGAYEYQGVPWHPMLVGDVDGDGTVGFSDLLEVLSAWGECDPECCPADIDFSWEVNFDDLLIVLSNWS